MDTYTARKIVSLSVFAAAVVIGGCKATESANIPSPFINEQFRPDDEPRAVDDMVAMQAANAAREDGTFYAQHFTGNKLNGLGYDKLSAMTYGPKPAGAMAIYIDVPKGETFFACQDSVMKAMIHAGYAEDAYTITAGPNPGLSTPAAQGLGSLSRLSAGSGNQSAPDAVAGAAAAPR